MKPVLLLFLITAVSISVIGQKARPATGFDIADFNRKFETAQWLVEYDMVAWKTSDLVMAENETELAKLGREWFCFQGADKKWHAVYGRLTEGKFQLVFHYVMDAGGKVSKSAENIDSNFLDAHATALNTALSKLTTALRPGSPVFNQYIRKNVDGSFGVWMLPAFQRDGTAVYGGEAFYNIDSAGKKIIKEEIYFQEGFRGFKSAPPREIWLSYKDLDKPTLGAIFFVWYYKSYFTQIFIDNAKTTSTAFKDPASGHYIWVHVEKDTEKQAKP